MSQSEDQSADKHSSDPKPKKPYKKPEFRYEEVFETMALACGKLPSTCPGAPHRS